MIDSLPYSVYWICANRMYTCINMRSVKDNDKLLIRSQYAQCVDTLIVSSIISLWHTYSAYIINVSAGVAATLMSTLKWLKEKPVFLVNAHYRCTSPAHHRNELMMKVTKGDVLLKLLGRFQKSQSPTIVKLPQHISVNLVNCQIWGEKTPLSLTHSAMSVWEAETCVLAVLQQKSEVFS